VIILKSCFRTLTYDLPLENWGMSFRRRFRLPHSIGITQLLNNALETRVFVMSENRQAIDFRWFELVRFAKMLFLVFQVGSLD
jgi:hypothetical protein